MTSDINVLIALATSEAQAAWPDDLAGRVEVRLAGWLEQNAATDEDLAHQAKIYILNFEDFARAQMQNIEYEIERAELEEQDEKVFRLLDENEEIERLIAVAKTIDPTQFVTRLVNKSRHERELG